MNDLEKFIDAMKAEQSRIKFIPIEESGLEIGWRNHENCNHHDLVIVVRSSCVGISICDSTDVEWLIYGLRKAQKVCWGPPKPWWLQKISCKDGRHVFGFLTMWFLVLCGCLTAGWLCNLAGKQHLLYVVVPAIGVSLGWYIPRVLVRWSEKGNA